MRTLRTAGRHARGRALKNKKVIDVPVLVRRVSYLLQIEEESTKQRRGDLYHVEGWGCRWRAAERKL